MSRTRYPLLTFLSLLALLFAIPMGLTWREVRQERLNRDLIAAIRRNDTLVVRSLLRRGANPNAPVLPQDSRSFWQCLLDLLRHRSALRPAETSCALLEAMNWDKEREPPLPLDEPSRVDNVETVKALVDAGANVNVRGSVNIGEPTMTTHSFATTPLILAARMGKIATMKLMLAHQADVNARDNDGDTALYYTVWNAKYVSLVETLLNRGADVNARDNDGDTALMRFLRVAGDDKIKRVREMVACLLRHGASVKGRDPETGDTVLSLASHCDDEQLIQMLKQAGAKE